MKWPIRKSEPSQSSRNEGSCDPVRNGASLRQSSIVSSCNWLQLRAIVTEGVNKSKHPIQNPLLLVTEPRTCEPIVFTSFVQKKINFLFLNISLQKHGVALYSGLCGSLIYRSSLTRGRVCLLYMLLALASVVLLGSKSLWTCNHILLSQIWDFPFRCLLRLAGSRWGIRPRLHTGHGWMNGSVLPL
jgi:hypothetical protein